jgi:hypothetical protein
MHSKSPGARALATGTEPTAPWRADAYCTRPGSWFSVEGVDFEDVLLERFGHNRGRVMAAE